MTLLLKLLLTVAELSSIHPSPTAVVENYNLLFLRGQEALINDW